MWNEYHIVNNVADALMLLKHNHEKAKIIAGGTDLILELERGLHPNRDLLIDISRIPGLDNISKDDYGDIHIGPLVTHNQIVASAIIRENVQPLAVASWQVGSPQIRNRGTVVGNLVTASPANDTITPLTALGALLVLRSQDSERTVPLSKFFTGVRKTVLQGDEMVVDIIINRTSKNCMGSYYKFALRNAQAISVVNGCVWMTESSGQIVEAKITLGAVAPTIIFADDAQSYLIGKSLSKTVIDKASDLAALAASPIDDIRSSSIYRRDMVRVVINRCLNAIMHENSQIPKPIGEIRNGDKQFINARFFHNKAVPIVTEINGKQYEFQTGQNKSLLRLLREDAGLIGTKEGCGEGECGACTVLLDGKAVMSCLVPAPMAHGSKITTIEGVSTTESLHPVQTAFIQSGAVQCGYCTPGFIMSAVALLNENPYPTRPEIMNAFTGNLCRCTGYYKIIEAVELAASMMH